MQSSVGSPALAVLGHSVLHPDIAVNIALAAGDMIHIAAVEYIGLADPERTHFSMLSKKNVNQVRTTDPDHDRVCVSCSQTTTANQPAT